MYDKTKPMLTKSVKESHFTPKPKEQNKYILQKLNEAYCYIIMTIKHIFTKFSLMQYKWLWFTNIQLLYIPEDLIGNNEYKKLH